MKKNYPRVLIAAPASGSGKTTVTCALIQAFCCRGYQVASFKCGPDYIDSLFHQRIFGVKTGNLDTYFTEEETVRYLFSEIAKEADLSIIEGAMGFYDGLAGKSDIASSYEVAKVTDSPVILVVDAGKTSLSILPVIKGFLEWKADSHIKGIILNQISPSIYPDLKQMIEQRFPVKVCGFLPKNSSSFDSRHLGLILPQEISDFKEQIQKLGDLARQYLDLDAIFAIASKAEPCWGKMPKVVQKLAEKQPGKVHIAIAMDKAFQFYYQENFMLLKLLGAELFPFSPLSDQGILKEADGILLGGGYPELYAEELEANKAMRRNIFDLWKKGIPFLAECGGFLYLQKELEDQEGRSHLMTGIFPAKAFPTKRLRRFGYVELELLKNGVLGEKGEKIKGHEFHYWDCEENGQDMLAHKPLRERTYSCMVHKEHAAVGFPHLYYYSNPELLSHYLFKCRQWRNKERRE